MLTPVRRAASAVLHVIPVALVAIAARVQHGALRSRHWAAPAALSVATLALGLNGWMWLAQRTNGWMW